MGLLRPVGIQGLLDTSDIVTMSTVSEWWLNAVLATEAIFMSTRNLVQQLAYLNNLDANFHAIAVSTIDYTSRMISGHPPGGVAILWRRNLDQYISPVDVDHDCCTAIEISVG